MTQIARLFTFRASGKAVNGGLIYHPIRFVCAGRTRSHHGYSPRKRIPQVYLAVIDDRRDRD